jgi:hypothetical protein
MSERVPLPDADLARAAGYARQALAPATLAAYAADRSDFETWCRGRGVTALPADLVTVAAYLAAMAAHPYQRHAAPPGRRHPPRPPTTWRDSPLYVGPACSATGRIHATAPRVRDFYAAVVSISLRSR